MFNNSTSIEIILSNQEFNSLEKNDPQVILVKYGGRPSRPATGKTHYIYCDGDSKKK